MSAWSLLAATVLAAGGVGEEFRWLGGVALSEVLVGRVLCWWWPGLLARPSVRLGCRLVVAAVLLRLLGIAMPDAAVVGGVFLFTGVAALVWLGVVRVAGVGSRDDRLLATVAVAVGVGLWFSVLRFPRSGWSATTALLAAAAALDARRGPDAVSPNGEGA